MPENDESFVSRWSRRKQQVAKEESDQDSNSEGQIAEEVIDPVQLKAEKLEALNKLSDEDMPDIETLNEDSDFTGFMSTSVSEGLRSLALKKLFMGKSYSIRDGLDDYDGDYTVFDKMPSTMVTSDMKHMIGVEAKKQLAKEQEEERQKMIASGEIDEELDNIAELDEFADEESDMISSEISEVDDAEEYVDEYINVDGFDTTVASTDEEKNTNGYDSGDDNDNEKEEVA